ncbi:MlaD family protein [Acetobacteraceae bacterium KSS12]|uniref:MlaD family protein n=1 Tax=Rhizosaccharibacter radicis TaxID=2782605 RepID=A0ABT1W0A5_9PROT|nr:MlaD family protein [Acetobacteraceae bacterium KSS12]
MRPARFSLIWVIPILVVGIAGYLAWKGLSHRGPTITITFDTADGLTAGQTQVKHKAVALGTVESIALSKDLRRVEVKVQMSAQAAPFLTKNAQFWVVRPRLTGASVSGLETLVSGAFIAVDPGAPGGEEQDRFTGTESPPGVRSDEPGRTYTLMTGSIGAISEGAPVFFRDVVVGEVLGYTMPPGGRGPIPVQVFVREPYDHYLRADTRFWDVSGIRADFSGGGLKIQVQSLQAVLSGGIAFGLPVQRRDKDAPEAPDNAVFKLYDSKEDADTAGYRERLPFVTYFRNSVKGLGVGSPVDLFGLQVGTVTDVKLLLNNTTGDVRVRVAMEIQPERVFSEEEIKAGSVRQITQAMVNNGLRAETDSSNLLTGSSIISLAFVPKAPPVEVVTEDNALVLPSQSGGLSGIMESLSTVSAKLAAMPLDQIGDNVNSLLAHADGTLNGPDVKQSLRELNATLRNAQSLTARADQGLAPLMQRLPQITQQLQQAVTHADSVLSSYGGSSDFHRNLEQTLHQLNDTVRSLRLFVDFLNRHPSALLFGRGKP